jgi:hypothetical protein
MLGVKESRTSPMTLPTTRGSDILAIERERDTKGEKLLESLNNSRVCN